VSHESLTDRVDALIRREQAVVACPYPLFAELRRDAPIYSESLGAWMISRYDDVRSILRDTERFSSLLPTGPQSSGESLMGAIAELSQEPDMAAVLSSRGLRLGRAAVLLNADPPDHRRQRRLVNPAFRPDRIRSLEPAMRSTARDLLDDVRIALATDGSVDIVARYAVGLPMTIIALALGVPVDRLDTFKRWSDDIVMPVGNHSPSIDQVRGFLISSMEFNEYFLEQIAERRRVATDDVLSDIANAVIEGEELSEDEQLGMLQQFLVAGNETTTKLITNIVRHLAENPEVQDEVRSTPGSIESLVEEMLRVEAPVGGLFRRAKVDVDVGGARIPAGDHVWLLYASANRDECRFAEPDRVDLGRANSREHLAFGNGEHFCPGAGLARAEARVAIETLLEGLGHIELAPGNDFRFDDSFVLRGLRSLVVTARPMD